MYVVCRYAYWLLIPRHSDCSEVASLCFVLQGRSLSLKSFFIWVLISIYQGEYKSCDAQKTEWVTYFCTNTETLFTPSWPYISLANENLGVLLLLAAHRNWSTSIKIFLPQVLLLCTVRYYYLIKILFTSCQSHSHHLYWLSCWW